MQVLSYISHLFISKRRHGTHSPFVYAYADQVLHPLRRMGIPWKRKSFVHNQQRLIIETLRFLNPKSVSSINAEKIDAIIKQCQYQPTAPSPTLKPMPITILGDNSPFELKDDQIFILLDIYKDEVSIQNWNSLIKKAEVQLSLDLWYFGILIKSEIFKNKSDFKLK